MRKNFKSSNLYKHMLAMSMELRLAQIEWWSSNDGRKRKDEIEKMKSNHPRVAPDVLFYSATGIGAIGGKYSYVAEPHTTFIDVSKADKVQRKALEKWLMGQTRPLIPGIENSCYTWDYDRFYEYFIRGEEAVIND